MAWVFAISLVGMMVGACIFSPLADRFGRKRLVILTTALFGIFSIATATSNSYEELLAMRFLTGCGLGGAMPNAVSLSVDYFPRKLRATTVAIVFVGFTIGATAGGYLAAAMLPAFGWRSIFYVGGVLPLLFVPILAFGLPESVRLLILHGSRDAEIARNIAKIDPAQSFTGEVRFFASEENEAGIPVKHLFSSGRSPATLLIWVIFFSAFLSRSFSPVGCPPSSIPPASRLDARSRRPRRCSLVPSSARSASAASWTSSTPILC
jgi:AAHS family 4-hydroxybenzoate transporter-like MFS transporter